MKRVRASWLGSGGVVVVQSVLLMPAWGQTDSLGVPTLRMSQALSISADASLSANLPLTEFTAFTVPGSARPCAQEALEALQPLHLSDVLDRIACRNPRMQQAMASIAEQHAGVILAELAQGPRFSANAELNITQAPATTLLAATQARSAGAGISLSWVLFDFGAGSAGLRAARSQLTAAFASQSSAQLVQLTDGLRFYTESLRAHARLSSLQDAEKAARLSLDIASGRYAAQVGSLAEKLQAQSALAQTQLDLTRAQGLWKTSQGNLVVAMGLPVQRHVQLASVEQVLARLPVSRLNTESKRLTLEGALESLLPEHPRLQAARAEVDVLQARLEQTKAQNNGTVSVNSGLALSKGLGGTSGREADRNINIGVQASIPLFDNRSQNAREAQLAAQISSRQAQINLIERELQIDLWRAVQQLQSETENLKASEALLSATAQGREVASGRYQAGIGSMLELLNAQNLHNQAVFQRVEARIALMQSQLGLALQSMPLEPRHKN